MKSIFVNGPITIETKVGNVIVGVWSDGSISFEVTQGNKQIRYWLEKESKAKIYSDEQRRLRRKKAHRNLTRLLHSKYIP